MAVSDGGNRLLPIAILGGVSLAAALALPGNRLWYGSIRSGQARSPADRPAAPESRRLGQSPMQTEVTKCRRSEAGTLLLIAEHDITNVSAGGEG